MFESEISKKSLFIALLLSAGLTLLIFIFSFFDRSTKLVFCDVGQGDGTYVRVKNRFDILIDAGPDRKILDCLGKYIPFYDREIEIAILTHPEKDHFGGFDYVLDRYNIDLFLVNPVKSSNLSYQKLETKIDNKKIKVSNPMAGTKINFAMGSLDFFWPTREFLQNNISKSKKSTNDFSLIFKLNLDRDKALFTGDSSPLSLSRLLKRRDLASNILKIPHHGSKNGLTREFLILADPHVGVISVGKNNSYGHPAKEILDMLKAQNISLRRTDLEGDIIFRFFD